MHNLLRHQLVTSAPLFKSSITHNKLYYTRYIWFCKTEHLNKHKVAINTPTGMFYMKTN
jgi:hypothetical protein